ncbi:hypothetical protein [Vibrio sp. SCSIO 43137]|uniref:hypothetical protein n=1 Tax=Vibrio sp. SCSIO 43137 TaxID=3021011 RepID=UPI002307ECD8|nr:hypothetical protein [Vibrio sp. SCSIO 43137]WCE31457.1 hypothetical protein PK654_20205 [Vibrio sp. SCSIO 43137]
MNNKTTELNQAGQSQGQSQFTTSAPRNKQQWLSSLLLIITCSIIIAFLSDSLIRYFQ